MHFLCDVLEVYHLFDVEYGLRLLRLYVVVDILLEAPPELRYVRRLHRQSGGVCMSSEVLQQVAAMLDCFIYVEAGN